MKRIIILLIVLSTLFYGCSEKKSNYCSFDGFAQSGTYHITCNLDKIPANIINSIPDSLNLYFNQINKSLSGYDSTSIITAVNSGKCVPLDKIFIEVFNASKDVYKKSNGAFNVTAAPLFDAWGFGFKEKVPVTQTMIDSIKQFISFNNASIIQKDTSINGIQEKYNFLHFKDKRMKINFNAIAQGYTSDYIASKFESWGMTDYLIEVGGGEIYAKGVNAKGKAWKIGLDKPIDGNFIPGESIEATITISNQGVATSGNYRKFYIENGEKYSHTINPSTGYPVKHTLLSATVIAPTATLADAYSTYFMVIGLKEAQRIIENTPELGAVLVYGEQENMKIWSHNCNTEKID